MGITEEDFLRQVAPNQTQATTLYILLGMSIGIGIFWHVPYLKEVLLPFKIFTVVLHGTRPPAFLLTSALRVWTCKCWCMYWRQNRGDKGGAE